MTKEAILEGKHLDTNFPNFKSFAEKQIFSAMDQYAKQESVEFLEWVTTRFNKVKPGVYAEKVSVNDPVIYPTDLLYKLFLYCRDSERPFANFPPENNVTQ